METPISMILLVTQLLRNPSSFPRCFPVSESATIRPPLLSMTKSRARFPDVSWNFDRSANSGGLRVNPNKNDKNAEEVPMGIVYLDSYSQLWTRSTGSTRNSEDP